MIEKYEDPAGDGNGQNSVKFANPSLLRNTKTPQGTETLKQSAQLMRIMSIEKYEDPAGDGNILLSPLAALMHQH